MVAENKKSLHISFVAFVLFNVVYFFKIVGRIWWGHRGWLLKRKRSPIGW